jgi:hypothetical protein
MSIISAGTSNTTSLVYTGDTTGNLAFQINGTTEAMRIDTSGNVGIGASSPSQKLHVNGAALIGNGGVNEYLYFDSTLAYVGRNYSTGDIWLNAAGSQAAVFGIGGTEKVRVDGNGNLKLSAGGTQVLNSSGRPILNQSGSVLQVASYTKTDTASTNSTSYVDTGLSVSITPSTTSSKILIMLTINYSHSDFGVKRTYFRMTGGNSSSYVGGAGSSGHTDAFAVDPRAGDGYGMITLCGSYLDSPSTTSAITYKLQWSVETSASTAYMNRPATEDANGSRTASTITVMEIAG